MTKQSKEFSVHTDPNEFTKIEENVRKEILDQYGWKINCFRYYQELKQRFPEAVCFYDGNHICTMLNGNLYDKHGLVMYNFKEMEPKRYADAPTWAQSDGTNP